MGRLGDLGRALGEGVRNFREELVDPQDRQQAVPASPKPRESVPSQLGTAVRKGRDAVGLDGIQSDIRSLRSELGDLKRSVDRERDGVRDSLRGRPNAREGPDTGEGSDAREGPDAVEGPDASEGSDAREGPDAVEESRADQTASAGD